MGLFPLKRKSKKKWIQGMNMKEGSFTAQAMAAKMGVQEFAAHVLANKDKFSTTTIRRAVLAQRFNKMSKA
jgi:hypothetical protein